MTPLRLSPSDLLDQPPPAALAARGNPVSPVAVIDLRGLGGTPDPDLLRRIAAAATGDRILVGRCDPHQTSSLQGLLDALTLTLVDATGGDGVPVPSSCVPVPDPDRAVEAITRAVHRAPVAARTLAAVLRRTPTLPVRDALAAESSAYSMLLAGAEFRAWRSQRPVRPDCGPSEPAVLLRRDGPQLWVTLNRPQRHNAFSRWVRDAACEALDLAALDPTIEGVTLRGAGASFCSGGDLDEFGSQPDVAVAHRIRMARSVGARLHDLGARTVADLHGACIGAGMELAAFADEVQARDGTWFALPELAMGLIPGAGGTVSLPRRIGRWRSAWLVLTGHRLDLETALDWGLVDRRVER